MTTSIRSACALSLVTALLAGCAGTELKTTEMETFQPRIFADGTKTFTYTLEDHDEAGTRTFIQFQDQRLQDKQNPADAPPTTEEQVRARAELRFYRLLERKLENTGFCRKGYITLESDIDPGKSMLRGECREEATAQDRERFADFVKTR